MNRIIIILSMFLTLSGCSIQPEKIEYNSDECAVCRMIISDKRFGAELVTTKGKVYKFDSIECLIESIQKNTERSYEFILGTDFTVPDELVDVQDMSFLTNKHRPSPMGASISAYKNIADIDIPFDKQQVASWDFLIKRQTK